MMIFSRKKPGRHQKKNYSSVMPAVTAGGFTINLKTIMKNRLHNNLRLHVSRMKRKSSIVRKNLDLQTDRVQYYQ